MQVNFSVFQTKVKRLVTSTASAGRLIHVDNIVFIVDPNPVMLIS